MRTMYGIENGHRHEEATPASVWICPECFDVYGAVTESGDCPNPGHAPVQLLEAAVRPSGGVAPASRGPALAFPQAA